LTDIDLYWLEETNKPEAVILVLTLIAEHGSESVVAKVWPPTLQFPLRKTLRSVSTSALVWAAGIIIIRCTYKEFDSVKGALMRAVEKQQNAPNLGFLTIF